MGHFSTTRPGHLPYDGVHESISRLRVKIDNGLEKPNQGLKKAEKVKNSDQTSVRSTRSQRREARVRPVHSRTRLPFLRKNYAATSILVNAAFFTRPVSTPGIYMRLILNYLVVCFCTQYQKKRLTDWCFENFRLIVNFRLIDSRTPSDILTPSRRACCLFRSKWAPKQAPSQLLNLKSVFEAQKRICRSPVRPFLIRGKMVDGGKRKTRKRAFQQF
jgi:hypothetical protein